MKEKRAWHMRDDNFDDVCLHVHGRRFRTRRDLAHAFIHRVEESSLQGHPDLTPLLHNRGVEMLYVATNTPMAMHDVRDHSLDEQHRPNGGATMHVSGHPRPQAVPEPPRSAQPVE